METGSLYLDGEEKFGPVSSKIYSFFSGLYSWGFYRSIAEDVLSRKPENVLDVGCGPGNVLRIISRNGKNVNLFGVDPSSHMVARDKRLLENSSATIEEGSSRSIPFNQKFDTITSSFSFHHWVDRVSSLENVLGHLSAGGTTSIYELSSDAFPGKIPFVKQHSVSADDLSDISIPGYRKEVGYINNGRIIVFRLRHEE